MREKLNQIHKNLRKELKEEYFRKRRTELLLYREKESLQTTERRSGTSFDRYGWRGVALERDQNMQEETWQRMGKNSRQVEFQMVLRTIEDGQYYLNIILEEAGLRCFQATVYLLVQLITQLLNPAQHYDYLQTKTQTNLVYMILTHAYNLLQTNCSHGLRRSRRERRYLCNLFALDYKKLLGFEDEIIVNQLIDIAQVVCNEYNIPPNYELIKYILLRIATKENIRSREGEGEERIKEKMEHLLLKFIMHCRLQQKSNFKEMNVSIQQIIYDYNTYIEFNLINLHDFIRNHNHPFHFGFLNQSLSYILTLQIMIIKRFRLHGLGNYRQELGGNLVKGSVVGLIEKIIVAKQEKEQGGGEMNEISIVLEEAVTVILWYLIDCQLQNQNTQRGVRRVDEHQELAFLPQNSHLLSLILLVKVKLRELQPDYD